MMGRVEMVRVEVPPMRDFVILALATLGLTSTAPAATLESSPPTAVESCGDQLTDIDTEEVATSGLDLGVVEYARYRDDVQPQPRVREVYERARALGFVPYACMRDLDRPIVNAGLSPTPLAVTGATPAPATSGGRRLNPGRFYALTAPRGYGRARLTAERSQGRSTFTELDDAGEVVFEERERFRDSVLALTLTYGVTNNLELGVELPATRGESTVEVVVGDPETFEFAETGLGNVRLLAGLGWSFNEEADNVLLEARLGLPTDSRSAAVSGGADASLLLNLEHFWGSVGIVALAGADWFAERGFEGGEAAYSWAGGIGAQLSERAFVTLTLGQFDEVATGDFSLEVLLGSRSSLELFGGSELEGDRDAWFGGVSVSLWLGGS